MTSAALVHQRVSFRSRTAERTGLATASTDLVVAFEAFHWFAAESAMREFLRILRSAGRFAAAWNNHDLTDPFTAQYSETIARSSGEAALMRRGRIAPPQETLTDAGFIRVEREKFAYHHRVERKGLLGRARSASYLPLVGTQHDETIRRLMDSYARFGDNEGYVTFRYRSVVTAPTDHEAECYLAKGGECQFPCLKNELEYSPEPSGEFSNY